MNRPTAQQAARLLLAAEALRKALQEAACVMSECPHCNSGEGLKAAHAVWKALDLYEPAAIQMSKALEGIR